MMRARTRSPQLTDLTKKVWDCCIHKQIDINQYLPVKVSVSAVYLGICGIGQIGKCRKNQQLLEMDLFVSLFLLFQLVSGSKGSSNQHFHAEVSRCVALYLRSSNTQVGESIFYSTMEEEDPIVVSSGDIYTDSLLLTVTWIPSTNCDNLVVTTGYMQCF